MSFFFGGGAKCKHFARYSGLLFAKVPISQRKNYRQKMGKHNKHKFNLKSYPDVAIATVVKMGVRESQLSDCS